MQDIFTKLERREETWRGEITVEVILCFSVPEAVLSDRGTNLLCKVLGIEKLNTTAYYLQCDGAVDRFNRILKTAYKNFNKHAARFGYQWAWGPMGI